jgi:16S rRNA (guanine966-N2)-methyltransferase
MSLRIISGRWKGRRIDAPPGDGTRPLTDRIKQSLFDWLGQDFTGQRIADVCSGSGSFAFEAASRGAAEVHAIESGRTAAATWRKNWQHLGSPPEVILHLAPFALALPRLRGLDLVFADPPFPWWDDQPELLDQLIALAANALAPGSALVLRGEEPHQLPALPAGMVIEERRAYGRSWVAAIRRG